MLPRCKTVADSFSDQLVVGKPKCRDALRHRRNRPHQGRRVDLICHGGLREVDQREQQEFGIVENRKRRHLGGAKREQQDLNDGDQSHQQDFGGVVDAGLGHLDLLGHRHDGGGNQEDFDPRELVPQEIEQRRSRIGEDVLPDDVEDQDIEKSRHETESASPFAGGSIPAYDYRFRMVCI